MSPRVLIADDDFDNRTIAQEVLKKAGNNYSSFYFVTYVRYFYFNLYSAITSVFVIFELSGLVISR